MATVQYFTPYDQSTFANFFAWANPISNALGAAGYTQLNDTGQVVWTATVLTLTQVAVGATAVYSYSSFTGPAPRVGMSVIFSGFVNGGNNVTATLTAVSGGSSGTVTVALTTQVNETHAGSGTTTAQTTVPGSGLAVYEIWQSNDGLSTYVLKIEYGNVSGSTNGPNVYLTFGTGSNGSGTITGTFQLGRYSVGSTAGTVNAGVNLECDISYNSTKRFNVLLFRAGSSSGNCVFGWERSLDSNGNYTGVHLTAVTAGFSNTYNQRSLIFGVTTTNALTKVVMITQGGALTSDQTNGGIPMTPIFPSVGYFDNPLTMFGAGRSGDYVEGAVNAITLYGTTMHYISTKTTNPFTAWNPEAAAATCLVRFD